jgi:hypothetical protein
MKINTLGVSIIVATVLSGTGCKRACQSIAQCVAQRPGDFPAPYKATSPVTATSRLGHLVRSEESYLVDDSTDCFYMTMRQAGGLDNIQVNYKKTFDVGLEVSAVVASVGASSSSNTEARFVLTNLREVTAHGIPNMNSGCFDDPGSFRVVTREIVAGEVELTFRRSTGLQLKADIPIPQAANVHVEPKLGWVGTSDGGARGSNVVIAAYPSDVRVRLERSLQVLGVTPVVGLSLPMPGSIDARVIVGEFRADRDEGKQTLSLRVTTPMGVVDGVSQLDLKTEDKVEGICMPGDHVLTPGESCTFWLRPGNKGFNVTWYYQMGEMGKEVVVEIVGYETSFVPPT